MKARKSIRVIILAAVLMLAFPTSVLAANYIESPWIYSVNNESVCIKRYMGDEKKPIVPWTLAGLDIKKIGAGAFTNTDVTTVYVPDNDVSIEYDAIPQTVIVKYYRLAETPDTSGDTDNPGISILDPDNPVSPIVIGGGGKIPGDDTVGNGKTDGGKTEGGTIEFGGTEGGNTEGGNTEGGKTDYEHRTDDISFEKDDETGGKTEGGKTDGGKTDGGKTEGGKTDDGKTKGGKTKGGTTEANNGTNGSNKTADNWETVKEVKVEAPDLGVELVEVEDENEAIALEGEEYVVDEDDIVMPFEEDEASPFEDEAAASGSTDATSGGLGVGGIVGICAAAFAVIAVIIVVIKNKKK